MSYVLVGICKLPNYFLGQLDKNLLYIYRANYDPKQPYIFKADRSDFHEEYSYAVHYSTRYRIRHLYAMSRDVERALISFYDYARCHENVYAKVKQLIIYNNTAAEKNKEQLPLQDINDMFRLFDRNIANGIFTR